MKLSLNNSSRPREKVQRLKVFLLEQPQNLFDLQLFLSSNYDTEKITFSITLVKFYS